MSNQHFTNDELEKTIREMMPTCPEDDVGIFVEQAQELSRALWEIDDRFLRHMTLCQMMVLTFERRVS